MLSIQKAKYIKSLQIKKYRNKHSRFLVEGAKNVLELLQSEMEIELLIATQSFYDGNIDLITSQQVELIIEKTSKIEALGSLKTNDAAIAVAVMPENRKFEFGDELLIALDDVRDPGNLGTIIRTADWFGVSKIIASIETADIYNSKVIQASMGSFSRVNVYYEDLGVFFQTYHGIPIVGAVLEGKPISEMKVTMPMILLMGNESSGISGNLLKHLNQQITIPRYGKAESLNVAMSTAIICDNIRRIESGLQ